MEKILKAASPRAAGLLQSVKLATVGREARTKGSEPKALALGIGRKGIFQRGKNAWAADVAVSSQDFAGGIQPVRGNDSFDGLDHITAASVRDEVLGRARSHSKARRPHRLRVQEPHGGVGF